MSTNQLDQEKVLEKPTDSYTITFEEADSVSADYITQSELEEIGFGIDNTEQGVDDEQ